MLDGEIIQTAVGTIVRLSYVRTMVMRRLYALVRPARVQSAHEGGPEVRHRARGVLRVARTAGREVLCVLGAGHRHRDHAARVRPHLARQVSGISLHFPGLDIGGKPLHGTDTSEF